jgi:hypothetical protein
MRTILQIISIMGLFLTIAPAFLHFTGIFAFETHKWVTFLGTAMYLASAPLWLNKKKKESVNIE